MKTTQSQLKLLKYIDRGIGYESIANIHLYAMNNGFNSADTCWDVAVLWAEGYIERIDAPVLLILFPFLRSPNHRADIPKDDELVWLTVKGRDAIYPVWFWRWHQ